MCAGFHVSNSQHEAFYIKTTSHTTGPLRVVVTKHRLHCVCKTNIQFTLRVLFSCVGVSEERQKLRVIGMDIFAALSSQLRNRYLREELAIFFTM